MTRVVSTFVPCLIVLTLSSWAYAEDSVELARERFNEGVELVDQGRFGVALAIFRELEQTRSHPVVVYNIGWCLSGLDRHAEAIETFESYLEQGDDSPERLERARQELERLRPLVQQPETAGGTETGTDTGTEVETVAGTETAVETGTEPERSSRQRLSPGLFWGFLGLTAATGAALIGIGAAAVSLSNQWQDGWVQEDRDQGEALVGASNGLLIALVCEAVVTLVLGFFTDFSRDQRVASTADDEL